MIIIRGVCIYYPQNGDLPSDDHFWIIDQKLDYQSMNDESNWMIGVEMNGHIFYLTFFLAFYLAFYKVVPHI